MVCCEDPLRKGAPLRPVGCPYEVTPEELHPLDVVRELLGHASVRSTEVYVHPDPDALRAAVDRLGPLRVGPVVGEQR